MKPWIDDAFQQDSALAHKDEETPDLMTVTLQVYIGPNMWPPNSSDLNPLHHYVWSVVERETNQRSYNRIVSLIAAIPRVIFSINTDHMVRASHRCRSRIEAITTTKGGYIE